MKHRKSLLRIFLVNYVISIIIFIAAIIVFVLAIILQTYLKNPNFNFDTVDNSKIFKANYKDINQNQVLKNKGWIEVVEDNKVKQVIGNKQDSIYEYNTENVLNNTDIKEKYDVKAYKENADNKEVLYVVKLLNDSYSDENDTLEKNLGRFALNALLITILFIIVVMFFMSLISIKILAKPLKKIRWGISEMAGGNYAVRLNFKTYKEINEIKRAFNFMVEKLQKAEEEKQISEESKKRMIRNISHDIKTPITSIMGYSKALIENETDNEEEKKIYLGYIYNKTLRLNYLVEGLFSFAKLDSPNYVLNKNVKDFGEFLRELVVLFYGELEGKEFNLVLDIPEKAVYANFDSKEMERAIGNLVVNAIKYNPPKTELKISLQENEEKIVVTIEDNGVGMELETINSLFNEFVRGDKARSSEGGSGLGLSITKRIVELHGGQIKLESEEGIGTKFIIYLTKK